jgi:hypothetical protein
LPQPRLQSVSHGRRLHALSKEFKGGHYMLVTGGDDGSATQQA